MKKPICPKCKEILDCHTPVDHRQSPGSGDLSVYLYCHTVLVFENAESLRLPSKEELEEFDEDPELKNMIWKGIWITKEII